MIKLRYILKTSLILASLTLSSTIWAQMPDTLPFSPEAKSYLSSENFMKALEAGDDDKTIEILDDLISDNDFPSKDRSTALFMKSILLDPLNNSELFRAKAALNHAQELAGENDPAIENMNKYKTWLNSDRETTTRSAPRDIPTVDPGPDRDAIPLHRVPGQVPQQALIEGRSGHCKMKFDVGSDGNTKNVIAYFCTHKMFELNSILAAQKFRYSPKILNGKPVEMKGVEAKITYRLVDENGNPLPE